MCTLKSYNFANFWCRNIVKAWREAEFNLLLKATCMFINVYDVMDFSNFYVQ